MTVFYLNIFPSIPFSYAINFHFSISKFKPAIILKLLLKKTSITMKDKNILLN